MLYRLMTESINPEMCVIILPDRIWGLRIRHQQNVILNV